MVSEWQTAAQRTQDTQQSKIAAAARISTENWITRNVGRTLIKKYTDIKTGSSGKPVRGFQFVALFYCPFTFFRVGYVLICFPFVFPLRYVKSVKK